MHRVHLYVYVYTRTQSGYGRRRLLSLAEGVLLLLLLLLRIVCISTLTGDWPDATSVVSRSSLLWLCIYVYIGIIIYIHRARLCVYASHHYTASAALDNAQVSALYPPLLLLRRRRLALVTWLLLFDA